MIFSSINKLKVRAKLILLLVLPSIALIYLGYTQLSLEQAIIDESNELVQFSKLSKSLSLVVYELQLERGLSSKLFFGKQDISKEMLQQYKKTDASIEQFNSSLLNKTIFRHNKRESRIEISHVIFTIKQVNILRELINNKENNFEFYLQGYTNLIHTILTFIQHLKTIPTDGESLHKIFSYLNLLQLGELAGKERAYLNKIFLKGNMDVASYQRLIGVISQQNALMDSFYQDAPKDFANRLKSRLDNENTHKVMLLRQAGLDKMKKDYLLNQIQNIIGYGGLIHDFKNYIVRNNQTYKKRFDKDMLEVQKLINQYSQLKGISKKERSFLNVIMSTLEKYQTMLPIVDNMRKNNATIKEIDMRVKVNDLPAKTAIGLLSTYVTGLETGNWSELSTTRIDAIRSVAVDIEQDILNTAIAKNELETFRQLIHIILLVGLLSILAILSLFLIKRIAFEVDHITRKIELMQSTGKFDQIIEVKGNDEIASMADAFNTLIEQQRTYQKQLLQQAYYDDLTGLANRKRCSEKIGEEIERSLRTKTLFSVLFIDLDRFKIINDSLGHQIGDDLLCQTAKRLKATIRKTDLLTRIGGDEFVIILTEVKSIQNVEKIANTILNILNKSFTLKQDHQAIISASIGIAMYPDDGNTVDSLLKNADTAMYQAKEKGKNQYQFFTSEMNNRVMNYMRIEQEMHIALECQQFELYYQPIFDLKTKKIASVEALVRWNSPENGLIFPDNFIPIAEDTGLIVPMGKWIMQEAMYQIKDWNNRFSGQIKMGINISSRQFCDRNTPIYQVLQESLDKTGVDPTFIEFEITENLLMDNSSELEQTLNKISKLGIIIYMDDFGTGYSSLSYLKKFPIDVIKIDRSFVWNMDKDKSDERLVRSIINMAKTMEISVLAEGVETTQHQELLQEMGCDYTQGYFYSKPIPAKELEELFLK